MTIKREEQTPADVGAEIEAALQGRDDWYGSDLVPMAAELSEDTYKKLVLLIGVYQETHADLFDEELLEEGHHELKSVIEKRLAS